MPEYERSDHRRAERDALIEEARRAADDPADRAEMRAVMADMEAVSTDWPDDSDDALRER